MRLLVIEGEKRMAGLLNKGLEEEGYLVSVSIDGTTGFEMPGMSGSTFSMRLPLTASS